MQRRFLVPFTLACAVRIRARAVRLHQLHGHLHNYVVRMQVAARFHESAAFTVINAQREQIFDAVLAHSRRYATWQAGSMSLTWAKPGTSVEEYPVWPRYPNP